MKKIVLVLFLLLITGNVFAQTGGDRVKVLKMPKQEVKSQPVYEQTIQPAMQVQPVKIEPKTIEPMVSSPIVIDEPQKPILTPKPLAEPMISIEPVKTIEPTPIQQKTTEVTININGIKNDNGKIMVLMFNKADAFPSNQKRAAENYVSAKTGAIAVKYTKVPNGDYAVIAYHDENENRELDKKLLGFFLKEGVGFSNGVKASFLGKLPSFEEAKFSLDGGYAEKTIEINLEY